MKLAERISHPIKRGGSGQTQCERFDTEERDFLSRQLNETRYIARLARTYLSTTGAEVWVTPGRLTADLRHRWGLNSVLGDHNREEAFERDKNRNDHRHHALDAVVVAMTDRALLQKVAAAAGSAEAENLSELKLLQGLGFPWGVLPGRCDAEQFKLLSFLTNQTTELKGSYTTTRLTG